MKYKLLLFLFVVSIFSCVVPDEREVEFGYYEIIKDRIREIPELRTEFDRFMVNDKISPLEEIILHRRYQELKRIKIKEELCK